MFGRKFFGARFFAPRYWGVGSNVVATPVLVNRAVLANRKGRSRILVGR